MNGPRNYIMRPFQVEAMQVRHGDEAKVAVDWVKSRGGQASVVTGVMGLRSPEGIVRVAYGDWVLRVGEHFWVVEDQTFRDTYQEVDGKAQILYTVDL